MYVNSKWELKISAQNQSFWSNLCYKIIIIMGQNLLANKSCSSKKPQLPKQQDNTNATLPPLKRFRKLKINYRNSPSLNKGENMDTLGSLLSVSCRSKPLLSLIRKPFFNSRPLTFFSIWVYFLSLHKDRAGLEMLTGILKPCGQPLVATIFLWFISAHISTKYTRITWFLIFSCI